MNKEDIIRMAREAQSVHATETWTFSLSANQLEHFAALVAAAKDAEHQQTLALQQRSYEREIQLEVEAEREECAKVCEGGSFLHDDAPDARFGKACAAAIRARTP